MCSTRTVPLVPCGTSGRLPPTGGLHFARFKPNFFPAAIWTASPGPTQTQLNQIPSFLPPSLPFTPPAFPPLEKKPPPLKQEQNTFEPWPAAPRPITPSGWQPTNTFTPQELEDDVSHHYRPSRPCGEALSAPATAARRAVPAGGKLLR